MRGLARLLPWLVALLTAAACTPRPVELGLTFEEGITYASTRIGDPITPAEFARIDELARDEIARAFRGYDVALTSNPHARFRVTVVKQLHDLRIKRGGTYAGESRAIAGFGGSGGVNFEFVGNGAMIFSQAAASRTEIIDAIGRGIGRVAIHEFLHQLLPTRPLHDSKDPESYEGNTAAVTTGYFGDLHWDIARPWLDERLAPLSR